MNKKVKSLLKKLEQNKEIITKFQEKYAPKDFSGTPVSEAKKDLVEYINAVGENNGMLAVIEVFKNLEENSFEQDFSGFFRR